MFCAPKLISDGTEGLGSHFHVLRSRTHFRRHEGRQVPFSCFALPNSFSTVPRRRLSFSYFALPDTFSAVLRASILIFLFCATGLIFGCTEGAGSCFNVLRYRTRFSWYRGHQAPFSWFVLPNSFLTEPSASGPVFMFYAPGLIFGGTEASGPVLMFCALRLIFCGTAASGPV
jgi:hypothetical protein